MYNSYLKGRCSMKQLRNWVAALACLLLAAGVTTAQEKTVSRKNVLVQLQVLNLQDGLPGLSSFSTAAVGTNFGPTVSTEKDKSGKRLYSRTINAQTRWLPDNAIEVTLEITENGIKRTETIRLEDFVPKTLVLREKPALGSREILRLIPVIGTPAQPASVVE
jgi:hypothetical protein